jgi:hypothetical protein
MSRSTTKYFIPVVAGAFLYGTLYAVALSMQEFVESDEPYPYSYALSQVLLEALTAVSPGFLAGWLSKGSGAAVGALAGVGGAAIAIIMVNLLWGALPLQQQMMTLLGTAAAAAISNSAGGLAGEHVRTKYRAV